MNGLQLEIINALLKQMNENSLALSGETIIHLSNMFFLMIGKMTDEDMHAAILEADEMIEGCGADNQPLIVLWSEYLRDHINTDKILQGVPF